MIGPVTPLPSPRELLPRPEAAAARPAASRPAAPPPVGPDQVEPMPSTVTFREFLAALNPLHHIPGVNWVYRQISGETIQPVFRVLGGLVTGGPIGAIASAVGALAERIFSGRDGGGADGGTALAAAPAPGGTAGGAERGGEATLASMTTTAGTALQPLPLATRLAARAYPAPALPLRDAAPPPDPAAGVVAAAAALPGPDRAAGSDAPGPNPAAAAPSQAGRLRRAPVVPITSGGQDPAFVQKMMRGLEAYERVMRARTAPAAPDHAAPAAAP